MPTDALSKWLVVFNCQAAGLGSCLELLNDSIDVEAYDAADFAKRPELMDRLGEFSRIIVAPAVEKHLGLSFPESRVVRRVPVFNFAGFHPDHLNLTTDGSWTGGPMFGNHSALCYAGFAAGLGARETAALFRGDVFERLGYLDSWGAQRDAFLNRYRDHGMTLDEQFVRWSRIRGGFAHVPSHPKMQCIKDIAEALIVDAGLPVQRTEVIPHDNLANGVIFPVYPEIASRLGTFGDYRFKPPRRYRFMNLDEFVSRSFEFYASCATIVVPDSFSALTANAAEVVADMM